VPAKGHPQMQVLRHRRITQISMSSGSRNSKGLQLWTRSPASSNRPFCFDYGCSQLGSGKGEKENGRRILCRVESTICETDVRMRKRQAGSCLKASVGGARWSAVRNRVRRRVAPPFERMACEVKSKRSWLKQQACSAGSLMAGRWPLWECAR
jgi:hypothetical protein